MVAGEEWWPHHLYRLYDADQRLLYVGIARDLCVRLRQHQRKQPWWPQVAGGTTEVFPDWFAAGQAERATIADEHPIHNKVRALRADEHPIHNKVRALRADDHSASSALRVPQGLGPKALPETLVDLRGYLTVPDSALGLELSGLSKTRIRAGRHFPNSAKMGHCGHCHYCSYLYSPVAR